MKPVEIEFLMNDRLSGGIDGIRMKTNLLDASLKKIAKTVGSVFAANKAIAFGKILIDVRAEMEMTEKSFSVLAGSEEKAAGMLAELKDVAVKSPLSLGDITSGAQMLMGFNVSAEETVDVIKQISDVSMGSSQKFQSLLLAFSQMSSLGKVISQDLRQMATAGFNPLVEIARTTGKTLQEVTQAMDDGAVSVDMIKEAFRSATAQGGLFYRMTEKQAEGLAGVKAQFEDAIQTTLNEIGSKQQDIISGGYKMAASLVENYETVGKVLVGLIATYGSYRAALIVNYFATQSFATSQMQLGVVLARINKAFQALTATMMKNPFVLVATAVVGLTAAIWALRDSTAAEEKALKRVNDEFEKYNRKATERKNRAVELVTAIKDETAAEAARIRAMKDLMSLYPGVFKNMDDLAVKIKDEIGLKKQLNEEEEKYSRRNAFDRVVKIRYEIDDKRERLNKLGRERGGSAVEINIRNDAKNLLSSEIKRLEEDEKKWSKIYHDIVSVKKAAEKELTKPAVQNKDYWEQVKKTAESALEAMDVSEQGTAKWTAETKKIAEAQKQLDKYAMQKGGKGMSGAAKTAQEQADLSVKIANDAARETLELRRKKLENRQALLDIDMDGFAKSRKQVEINHEKELLAVDRYARELVEKQQEAERRQWEKAGKKGTFTPATATEEQLPQEQKDMLSGMRSTANTVHSGQNRELMEEMAKQYEDYAAKRISTEKKFTDDLTAMHDENGNLLNGITQAHVDELKRQMTEALATLDNEFSRTKTSIETLFDDMAGKSAEDMRKIADSAKAMMGFVTGGDWDADKAVLYGIKTEAQFKQLNAEWAKSPEKLAAIKKGIRELYNTADKSESAFKKMSAGLKKVFSSGGQADMEDGLSMISDGLKSVTAMTDMFAGSLRNIGELSGSEIFGQIADGISSVMDAANSTMQGAQAGAAFGPVGAAVGAALGLVSSITGKIAEAEARHQEALKEIANGKIAFQREYNLLLIEQNELLEKTETIFGVDSYGKALVYIQQMKKATAELNREIQGNEVSLIENIMHSMFDGGKWAKEQQALYEQGIRGLAGIQIRTGHEKTGLFGWGKGKDVYSSILEEYPELIDEDGKFVASVAEKIISARANDLSDDDVDTLQYMIDLTEEYKEALQSVKDSLSDIFGELGNTMSDAFLTGLLPAGYL